MAVVALSINIAVAGKGGTGKTTISKILSEKMPAIHINLTDIVRKEKLIRRVDPERETLVADLKKLSHLTKKVQFSPKDTILSVFKSILSVSSKFLMKLNNIFLTLDGRFGYQIGEAMTSPLQA
jgi:broad-specificity NMP kinase